VQYSTPAFAFAAAALAASGQEAEFLEPARRALDSALFQLASGRVTDRHGDFFIVPTMLAYRMLESKANAETTQRWNTYLTQIDPQIAYSDLIGKGQPDVINWNANAIAGEFLRHKDGFTDLAFVDRYLPAQMARFTPDGLYRDPGAPLVYDASARFNLLLVLTEGYDGPYRGDLETLLKRGAWLSLLMQSPAGDAPTGGRSAEHVWSDAQECAAFELWARRAQHEGDRTGALAFKRAAHLAGQSMSRWVRPSGEFWIVKNRFDPAFRRGFEAYSYHSQYNLLAAAYLAMAWLFADDGIPEGPAPAEMGRFVVELPAFHKIFANSGGNYLEIETAADPHYNSTGLLRVIKGGMDGRLGLLDNAPIGETPLALGIGWRTQGRPSALAAFPVDHVHASLDGVSVSPDAVRFEVKYALDDANVTAVTESYTLTPRDMTVTASFDGPAKSWRLTLPVFVSDGVNIGLASLDGSAITVAAEHAEQRFSLLSPPGAILRRTGQVVSMRTGDYEVFEAEGNGHQVSYRVESPVDHSVMN
jgi:hypothetical protein